MRKRTPLPLLAWCLAVLVLLQPLQALALSVTQGQPFGIPISLNSDEPFSELQISFSALEGLSFQGASGSMSHLGNGAFRSDTPITSGTITLTYRANDDAGPEQAVMVEGVVASGGEGEQRRYWGVGSSFRTEVSVAPAPPEEVWPETWTIVTPASCETQGLRQRTSNLGKVQEEVIEAIGHDYGEWTLVRAATLDDVGLEQRVCQHDPAHIDSRELPKLVQAWTDWVIVAPATCDPPGKEERISIHDASIRESREIQPLGHDYGEWTLVRAATLDALGLERRVCAHDPAHIESRELPKLVQAWSDWMVVSMPTCELPGREERVSIHDAGIRESRETAAIGHDYGEWTLVRAATLDAVRLEQRVCKHDPAHTETRELPKLVQAWSDWMVVSMPTCELPGKEERVSIHDASIKESREIPAIGHEYGEWTIVRAATLDAVGLEQRICKHDPAHIETRELPKLVQAWTDWAIIIPATCLKPGQEERVSIHDAGIREGREIPAQGHDWDPWKTTRYATCTALGREERVCRHDASHRIYRGLPLRQHRPGEWQVMTAPTYTRAGMEAIVCQVGGEWLESRTLAPLPKPLSASNLYLGQASQEALSLDFSRQSSYRLPLYDAQGVQVGFLTATLQNGVLRVEGSIDEGLGMDSVTLGIAPQGSDAAGGIQVRYSGALPSYRYAAFSYQADLRQRFGENTEITLSLAGIRLPRPDDAIALYLPVLGGNSGIQVAIGEEPADPGGERVTPVKAPISAVGGPVAISADGSRVQSLSGTNSYSGSSSLAAGSGGSAYSVSNPVYSSLGTAALSSTSGTNTSTTVSAGGSFGSSQPSPSALSIPELQATNQQLSERIQQRYQALGPDPSQEDLLLQVELTKLYMQIETATLQYKLAQSMQGIIQKM